MVLLAASFVAQLAWQTSRDAPASQAADLPAAPPASLLRAASFDEPEAAARVAMLYLQAYDLRGDNAMPYQHLDYERLIAWLRAIVATDPRSGYALFSAARVYTENPDAAKCRAMLEFLYTEFHRDPDRRWPWLAHAALVAKHRLKDLPLALHYARAIDRQARDPRASRARRADREWQCARSGRAALPSHAPTSARATSNPSARAVVIATLV